MHSQIRWVGIGPEWDDGLYIGSTPTATDLLAHANELLKDDMEVACGLSDWRMKDLENLKSFLKQLEEKINV